MTFNEKIIISLTTISSRISNLNIVLENLLKQDYLNFEIRIHISKEPYLLDEGILKIEDYFLKDEKIKYIFTENIGPYRKLLPVLNEFWNTNQAIVTVDDDVIYPINFLSTLITTNKLFDCPIAFRGRKINFTNEKILPYNKWFKRNLESISFDNLPTGKDGIFYRPNYFHKDVLNIDKAIEIAPTTDDLWFKWYISLNDKKSLLLFDNLTESFNNSCETTESLFDSFNKHTNNDVIVGKLEEYFKSKYNKTLLNQLLKG